MVRIGDKHVWLMSACMVSLLTITGCAVYQDRPLSRSKMLDDFESRTLDAPDLQAYLQERLGAGSRPPAAWNLPELTLAAFFYNPELDVVRAKWAVTTAQRQAAAERPNPTLGIAPGFNSTTGYGADISPWILATVLAIPVETAGKRGYRMAEAEHLSEAARLQIAQTAWGLRSQVRAALLDLYAAVQTADLLRRRQAVQEDNVALLERLFEFGGISANELGQARVARDEARLAILDAEKQQTQARVRLAAAMGVPAQALESEKLSFDLFERRLGDIPAAEVQRQALLNRADLRAALAEYQASQFALRQEIARQFPDIEIGPGYEFDQSENKWSVGFSLTLPVFNQNQGAIATAEARRAQAEAEFKAAQARIIADLEQAVRSYEVSLKKEKVAETLVAELDAATERIQKMYELGEVTKLEVDAAELESATGTLNRLNARVDTLRALGQIEDAMQVATDLPDWAGQIPLGRTESLRDEDHEK